MIKTRFIMIATVACSISSFAHAQESATIDVSATIVAAESELTVNAVRALQFGTVQLPAEPALGGCGYYIGPIGNPNVRGIDGPSDNCGFSDSNQTSGQFNLTCEPDSNVVLSVSFSSDVTELDNNIVFTTGDFDVLLDGASPYDGPSYCDSSGISEVTIGGDLAIAPDASTLPPNTQIGTITLNASY